MHIRFLLKIVCMMLLLVLGGPELRAEMILLKHSQGNLSAISYDKLLPAEKKEVDDIYDNILMKYQWPMLQMSYPYFSKEGQNEVLSAIEQPFGLIALVSKKLKSEYQDRYQVIYTPETIFEMGTIIAFAGEHDSRSLVDPNQTKYPLSPSIYLDNDLRNSTYMIEVFSDKDFLPSIKAALKKAAEDKASTKQERLSTFLYASFGQYNLRPEIKEMYFETCQYLYTKFQNDLSTELKAGDIVKSILEHYDQIEPQFKEDLIKKNPYIRMRGALNDRYTKLLLNDSFRNYLLQAVHAQYQAQKNGTFVLFRGTDGYAPNEKQHLLDVPSQHIKSEYDQATGGDEKTKNLVKQKFNIEEPKYGNSRPGLGFYPTSLSFGNTLLSGSFFEMGPGGARPLDYIINSRRAYFLSIPLKDYLIDSSAQPFFVNPFNTTMSMIAKGELSHSRSKISTYQGTKKIGDFLSGWMGGNEMSAFIAQDSNLNLGFMVIPVDWNKLSGQISHIIGEKATFITADGKPPSKDLLDELTNQKSVGNFEMESAGLKEHYSKLQAVHNELEKGVKLKPVTPSELQDKSKPVKSTGIIPTFPKTPGNSIPTSSDDRVYNKENIFWKIIQGKQKLNTDKLADTQNTLIFDDLRKRTKEHFLAVTKGEYISFPHFTSHAKVPEMVDLVRSIAQVAEKKGLDKTGYRIISNHALYPGQNDKNNANQEVPHFHVHVSGGECLGKYVAGVPQTSTSGSNKNNLTKNPSATGGSTYSAEMQIHNNKEIPFGFGLSLDQFLPLVFSQKLAERKWDNKNRRILAYRVPSHDLNIPDYIGFLILDEKKKPLYTSFHDFAKNATAEEVQNLFAFMSDVAKSLGLHETGYRIISNHGLDAWHYPDVFQMFIAGGARLGVTVTNILANRRVSPNSQRYDAKWDNVNVYDYNDLLDIPHPHCPKPVDIEEWFSEAKELPTSQTSIEATFKELPKGIKETKDNLIRLQNAIRAQMLQKNDPGYSIKIKIHEVIAEEAQALLNNLRNSETTVKNLELKYKNGLKDKKNLSELSNELNKIDSLVRSSQKFFKSLGKEDKTVRSLISDVFSPYNLPPKGTWIFMELDGVLTKGKVSTEWTENGLKGAIIDYQNKGYKVMGLTTRSYWNGMEKGKDTFDLLKTLGIAFSNPGNLQPFAFEGMNKLPREQQPNFKDGVIFVAGQSDYKGSFLRSYLDVLIDKKVKEFPSHVAYIDVREHRVQDVVVIMDQLGIPSMGYTYNPQAK